jgi:hypothetical protein
MTLLKISGKTYRLAGPEDLTLDDYLQFELQTRDYGMPLTIGQIIVARAELGALDLAEGLQHPLVHACSAATIWMCRRAAGEKVTFADAVKIPVSEVEEVIEDQKPGKAKAAKKPRTSTPKDSSQGDEAGLRSA